MLEPVLGITVLPLPGATSLARGSILIRRLQRRAGYSAIRARQEDDLRVGRLGHRLHGFQVSDLHCRGRGEDVGGLAHEFRGLDLGAGGDDFGLADALGLGGHGERVLQLVVEDDVFDQHALDLDAPSRGDVFDDLADGLGDLFAALDDVLEHAGADDVAQGGLRALDEGLADVGDAEGGFVRGRDVVVDHRGEVHGDVVLGHAHLLRHLDDLDLDVHLDQFLGQRVDLHETRVDGAVEAAEFGDESHVALAHGLVGVGADDAAGDSAAESNPASERVDCRGFSVSLSQSLLGYLDEDLLIDPYQPWVPASSLSPWSV